MVEGLAALLPDYFHVFRPRHGRSISARTDEGGQAAQQTLPVRQHGAVALADRLVAQPAPAAHPHGSAAAISSAARWRRWSMAPSAAPHLFRPSRPRQLTERAHCADPPSQGARLCLSDARAARSPARPNTAFPNCHARKRSSLMGDFNMVQDSPEYVLMTGERDDVGEAALAHHPVDVSRSATACPKARSAGSTTPVPKTTS